VSETAFTACRTAGRGLQIAGQIGLVIVENDARLLEKRFEIPSGFQSKQALHLSPSRTGRGQVMEAEIDPGDLLERGAQAAEVRGEVRARAGGEEPIAISTRSFEVLERPPGLGRQRYDQAPLLAGAALAILGGGCATPVPACPRRISRRSGLYSIQVPFRRLGSPSGAPRSLRFQARFAAMAGTAGGALPRRPSHVQSSLRYRERTDESGPAIERHRATGPSRIE